MLKKNTTNTSGESLSETLIAALIISFAMIMLFSCAKVGTDIMRKSNDSYQEYYEAINDYEKTQASYVVEYMKYMNSIGELPEPLAFGMEPHKHDWTKN
jgi:Tfp pilus assembly protein PilV